MLASREQLADTWDCVIVGGGIVGTACARRLAGLGDRCLIIEPRSIGGGATAAGMGHVVVMDDSQAQFVLTKLSRDLWDELSRAIPASVGMRHRGTLWIASDCEEMDGAEAKEKFYRQRNVVAEILSPGELYRREPNLRPGLAGALLVPGDSVVYPPVMARWLLDEACQRGARLLTHAAVSAINTGHVVLTDGTTVRARRIVNAAGMHAAILTPGLPIRARKGHLAITDRYPSFCGHQLVELGYLKNAHSHDRESVAFNVQPRETGQLLIGSSRQYDTEGPEVEPRILARMLGRAIEFMPGVASLSTIRVWAGFRAATPDSLPIIGPHESNENLFLACGHEGLGITTSLGTAEVLAAMMHGTTPPIPCEPYLHSRFTRRVEHA